MTALLAQALALFSVVLFCIGNAFVWIGWFAGQVGTAEAALFTGAATYLFWEFFMKRGEM